MKVKTGYLQITTGWLTGIAIGGVIGFFTAVNIETDPNVGFANLAVGLLAVAMAVIYAALFGLIACLIVMYVGKYQRIWQTVGYILLISGFVSVLGVLLNFPVILVPFIPIVSRYLAIRKLQAVSE